MVKEEHWFPYFYMRGEPEYDIDFEVKDFDRADIDTREVYKDFLRAVHEVSEHGEEFSETVTVDEYDGIIDTVNLYVQEFFEVDVEEVDVFHVPHWGTASGAKDHRRIAFHKDEYEYVRFVGHYLHELGHMDGHNEGNTMLRERFLLEEMEERLPDHGFQELADRIHLQMVADSLMWALDEEIREENYKHPVVWDVLPDDVVEAENLQHWRGDVQPVVVEAVRDIVEDAGVDWSDRYLTYAGNVFIRFRMERVGAGQHCDPRGPYSVDAYRKWKAVGNPLEDGDGKDV